MLQSRLKVFVTSYSEEVTGSNNHVKVEWPDGRSTSFLVDCGLFQEKEHNHLNLEKFPYKPQNILFVVATHVHTDHVGRLPYLTRCGFNGPIYCSYETAQLLPTVLTEAAERLEDDYRLDLKRYKDEKSNLRRIKKDKKGRGKKDRPRSEKRTCKCDKSHEIHHHAPVLIYTKDDVDVALGRVAVMDNYKTFTPCSGIEITLYPNAHIAGAVLTVCRIFDDNESIYMLFTGDLGLINPVTNVETDIPDDVASKIDIVVSESTYGSSEASKKVSKARQKHVEVIKDAYKKKGTIMYMSNSLERPLRLGVDLKEMQNDESIQKVASNFDIYLDTTFGIKCLNKYVKLYGKDYLPKNFTTIDKNSRQEAISSRGPKMIICTSPRLYQGSFLNYGARMLEDPNVTLVFVSYVPDDIKNIISLPCGTEIDFMSEKVTLRCKRYQFGYYSSHVSPEEMDLFLNRFKNANTILFNHGTHDSKNNFAKRYKLKKNVTHNLLYGKTVMLTSSGIEKYF